ncbi:MAG TPA: cytochrome d ubiquinol oxidase subunit II [Usitatibacter sp.]|nr:cytochrome d ubiquinol oxidase subunit II [Usitatibacter sp.]
MGLLPVVFMVLMGVAVLAYVVLDGYDLGVAMLMPAASDEEQSVMVSSIGPFWDANETWLVLGVGILLSAFPGALLAVMGALYLPVVAMLVGLMLRGVAFEFRMKALGWHRELWNWLFWAGSTLASFCQGMMLGRYVSGLRGGFGEWLFAVLVGASVCGGYVLMGATWLILKTEGELQRKSIGWARWGLIWVALGVALVSLATPLESETVRERWFDFPRTLWVMVLPLATVAAGFWLWRSTARIRRGEAESHARPFTAAAAIFVLAFLGLAYSLYPYIVMDRLTIWDAAAPPAGLRALLLGAAIVLPFIAAYTIMSYRIFGGKAKAGLYD